MKKRGVQENNSSKLYFFLITIIVFLVIIIVFVNYSNKLSNFKFTGFTLINFTSPTPDNGYNTTATYAIINLNISAVASLSEFIWNWNGTNYTFYNDSLILMMNLNNNSAIGENATYALDLSSTSSNGTFMNQAVWNSSGKYGFAVTLDGVDDYVDIPDSASIKGRGEASVEAWIRPHVVNKEAIIYAEPTTTNNDRRFSINMVNAKVSFGGRAPDWQSYQEVLTSNNVLTIGEWTHVTATVNVSTNTTKLYINGVEQATTGSSLFLILNFSDADPANIRIGQASTTMFFDGEIDEVIVHKRVLSTAEVKQHYFSNFYKYNPTSWNFYSNQSNLTAGIYTYFGYAKNSSGNANMTEIRLLNITSIPSIFVSYNISNCSNLTQAGATYYLNASISGYNGSCMNIAANNVTLDCLNAANWIDGDGSGTDYGVNATGVNYTTIKNCNITDFNYGVYFDSSWFGDITNNSASLNSNGIYLTYSFNNTLTNNTAGSNFGAGIYLVSSSNNTLVSNTVNSNANNGIYLYTSSYNNLANNIANSNNWGIYHSSSSYNTFMNNTINSNAVNGIYLWSSSNNTLTNNFAQNNTQWDYYSLSNSQNNAVTNLTTLQNLVSFTSRDIALKGLQNSEGKIDPSGQINMGRYFNATNNSASSWISLNISYTDSDIATVNENSLRIWKYNSTSSLWINTGFNSTGGVNETGNYVYANITSFSTFGVFGLLNTNLSSCANLNQQNTIYYLNQSVNSTGTCINILANNITLDCQGYIIGGSSILYGIYNPGYENVNIKNCVIKNFEYGIIFFNDSNNGSLNSNKIYNNYGYGIYLSVANSAIISNNIINSAYYGINAYGSNNNFTNNTVTATIINIVSEETTALSNASLKVYVNDSINLARTSITKTEMPNLLGDRNFAGDVDATYTQTIIMGSTPRLIFAKQPTSSYDPAYGFAMSTATFAYTYNSTITFDKAINFTHADSKNQVLTLFGQRFTVGAGTNSTHLILLTNEGGKFTLSNGNEVITGEANYAIDGTKVTFSNANLAAGIAYITISVAAENSDNDALMPGNDFVDPVFKTFKLDFLELVGSSPENIETIKVYNNGDDKMMLNISDYNNNQKSIQWAINTTAIKLQWDDIGHNIVVSEMTSANKSDYIMIGNELEGHLVKVSTITNQTIGYGNDDIKFTDVFTGDTYTATLTSEGHGTVTIGGKVYNVSYYGSNDLSDDSKYVKVQYPDSGAVGDMILWPTIATSKGAKLMFYKPLTINLTNYEGTGTTVTKIKVPNGANAYRDFVFAYGTQGAYTVDTYGVNATSTSRALTLTNTGFALNFTYGSSVNMTVVYLLDPEGGNIVDPALVLFEEKDDNNVYHGLIITLEPGNTGGDGLGINDVIRSWSGDGTWDVITLASDNTKTKEADLWGTIALIDASDSDQKKAEIYYPNEQIYAKLYESTIPVTGIKLLGSSNILDSNSISLCSYGIKFSSSSNNRLINNNIGFAPDYMYIDANSNSNTMANTTFSDTYGSIKFTQQISLSSNVSINSTKLNISFNKAYLNAASLSFLNSFAEITLKGLSYNNPRALYDSNDDGVYDVCPGNRCVEIGYSSGVFTYNVAGWTAYSSDETPTTPVSPPSGGGGGGGGGTTEFWKNTYNPSAAQLAAGYRKALARFEKVNFKVNNKNHYVGIISLTSSSVTINVSSAPQQATLKIGEEKMFEVSGDNYYDVYVKVNGISNNKADLTIRTLYEPIYAAPAVAPSPPVEMPAEAPIIAPSAPEIEPPKTSYAFYALIGILIAVIIIVLFLLFRSFKHKPKDALLMIRARAFVQDALARGYPADKLRESFKKKGWNDEEINQIM